MSAAWGDPELPALATVHPIKSYNWLVPLCHYSREHTGQEMAQCCHPSNPFITTCSSPKSLYFFIFTPLQSCSCLSNLGSSYATHLEGFNSRPPASMDFPHPPKQRCHLLPAPSDNMYVHYSAREIMTDILFAFGEETVFFILVLQACAQCLTN